ncbi:MAG: hypothetical protein HYT08_00390 [Candidatus Levybacteria bacterium]|nr:hypothetical protein [Candidatus Levybacteria bacterium]
MKETLKETPQEKKHSFLVRNALVALGIAFVTDRVLREGLNPEGRKLVRQIIVKAWTGSKVSVAREVAKLNQESKLSIHIDGQKHIPASGPTILITNHTHGGPLNNLGQYFEMVKEGYDARRQVVDDYEREPFIIVQRGLGKVKPVRILSGLFYDIVGGAFNCEIVEIPKYNEKGDIINSQNLRPAAIRRVVDGGASLWLPQGRERDPEDFEFPEKATGFLRKINYEDRFVQLVPVRSIPDKVGI